MVAGHGYGRYTNGCRCQVCRAAKAAYVRAKRASAAELRVWCALFGERYEATGITHGITGYQDHHCRCEVCRVAKAVRTARESRKKVSA